LLTGKCLLEGLGAAGLPAGAEVFLPDVMLREGEGRFLDGLTVREVSRRLGLKLVFLPREGGAMLAKLLGSAGTA
jgi:NifB/MoaA-like Fe-S oxidoreductase